MHQRAPQFSRGRIQSHCPHFLCPPLSRKSLGWSSIPYELSELPGILFPGYLAHSLQDPPLVVAGSSLLLAAELDQLFPLGTCIVGLEGEPEQPHCGPWKNSAMPPCLHTRRLSLSPRKWVEAFSGVSLLRCGTFPWTITTGLFRLPCNPHMACPDISLSFSSTINCLLPDTASISIYELISGREITR